MDGDKKLDEWHVRFKANPRKTFALTIFWLVLIAIGIVVSTRLSALVGKKSPLSPASSPNNDKLALRQSTNEMERKQAETLSSSHIVEKSPQEVFRSVAEHQREFGEAGLQDWVETNFNDKWIAEPGWQGKVVSEAEQVATGDWAIFAESMDSAMTRSKVILVAGSEAKNYRIGDMITYVGKCWSIADNCITFVDVEFRGPPAKRYLREQTAGEVMEFYRKESSEDLRVLRSDQFLVGKWIAEPGWRCKIITTPLQIGVNWVVFMDEVGSAQVHISVGTTQDLSSFREGDVVVITGQCTDISDKGPTIESADIRLVRN